MVRNSSPGPRTIAGWATIISEWRDGCKQHSGQKPQSGTFARRDRIRERVTTNLKGRAPAMTAEILPARDDKKLQVGPELNGSTSCSEGQTHLPAWG